MRRAQLQHVFAYLAALIVIVSILYLGAVVFLKVKNSGCEVQKQSFITELEDDIIGGKTFGAFNIKDYSAPCAAEQICFVDVRDLGSSSFNADISVLRESVRTNVQNNIFIIGNDRFETAGYVPNLVVQHPGEPLCLNITGSVKLSIRGLGRYAQVEVAI